MKTLEVMLTQHTPIIHFQPDQHGATLRASEVKPRLDRFIITKLGDGDYEKGKEKVNKEWLVGKGDHYALDYKLKFEPGSEKGYEDFATYEMNPVNERSGKRTNYPLFFGNMNVDDENEIKKLADAFYVYMIIFSLKDDVIGLFKKEWVCEFFLTTNFGTRQSKGFGSFYVDEQDDYYIVPNSKYKFNVKASNDEKGFRKLFDRIDLFYKTLRGGINLKDRNRETIFYFKSLAYEYVNKKLNANWDKKRVKEEFYYSKSDNKRSFDIRDMLGFSTNEQWLSYRDNIEKTAVLNANGDNFDIERMQSPILFKPIYNEDGYFTVYIIFQDARVNLSGFKESKKICFKSKKNHSKVFIDLPQDFSTEKYFNFIFNELKFDINTYVDDEYQEHQYFDILEGIYSQIYSNL